MTGGRDWTEEDDHLAAEFALGLLTDADAARAEARLTQDREFREAVSAWRERFVGMAEEVVPVAPPERLRAAVKARLFGEAAPLRWSPFRRFATLGAGMVSLALLVAVVLTLVWPIAPAPSLHATLQAEASDLRFEATYDSIRENFAVSRVAGAPAPAGRAYELWLIAPGAAPVSLGVIGEGEHIAGIVEPPAGWVLAVSLEPAGGSPTGAPTGPVLAAAPLTDV